MPPHREDHYQPKDAVKAGINASLVTGGAGLFASAVQNSLQKRNVGSWAVFTRTGGTIATFGAVGGAYEFTRLASANLRERDDAYNTAIGGFIAGSILGIRTGGIPAVLGYGVFTAAVLYTFDFTGGKLSGYDRDPDVDEYERKEQLRRNRRRLIEETIAELGEGRAIHPPGYEERRRQRLKEKYGVNINPVSASAD